MKKILVIGSAGREHAICLKFSQSKHLNKIYCLPGNAGIAEIAEIVEDIKINDYQKIIEFCHNKMIDFVFIGPEQPLVEGIVDILQKNNIRVFGPSKKAAQLEGSKIFMKQIASENNVPTANYQTFFENHKAIEFCQKIDFPCVIKVDGLAAGKGVIIAQNLDEAKKSIDEIFAGKFGEAGKKIIIEEFLTGFEVSYFVLCDEDNFISLGFAHDHKKIGEDETGLNTGGMGTFSPSPFINKKMEERIINEIIKPTLQGMKKANSTFSGILFAGLMIDQDKIKLLEFNTRFGDPETQVILPRIKTDFIDLIEAAINQNLDQIKIEFDEENKFVCVVMSTKGYPESYQNGSEIKNLSEIKNIKDTQILHAATIKKDDKLLANGGRVLNIVSFDKSFFEARKKAYQIIEKIDWENGFFRKDIAKKVENL
jgi:phosphoribosylamine--glycine ligase